MLPRIFDLFVQGDQTLARSDGGLGIGLTLLRSLVELHDGRVEAHERWRRTVAACSRCGSRSPRTGVARARAEGAGARFKVKTVVVVEDQEDARRMMQILLESKGLKV